LTVALGPSRQKPLERYQIKLVICNVPQGREKMRSVSDVERTGQDMEDDPQTSPEPSWLGPRNDRNTPYTDAELDILANDFIAGMADTAAWRDLVAEVGEKQARDAVRQRLAGWDPNSLIKWQPGGPAHRPAIREALAATFAWAGAGPTQGG
jgi:hypothetical protein